MENAANPTGNETNGAGTVEERARSLGRKVDSASARLQGSWGEATSQVKTKLGSTREHVKYKLQVAGEQAKKKLVVAKDRSAAKAQVAKVNVETQVKEHPLRSVAYAFGAGAIIGLLIRRTRR